MNLFRSVKVDAGRFGDVRMFGGAVRFPAFRSMRFYCYLVDGLLIDTGPVHARAKLFPLISGFRPDAIVLTHHHEDHTGNAAFFAERWDVPVHLTERTMKELESLSIPLYRRVVWGEIPERLTGGIKLGKSLEWTGGSLRVIPTPGHSEDHVALLDERRGWLFSGDLFVSARMASGFRFESVPVMIRSIEQVLKLSFETVFCAHAGVVPNGRKALEKKLEFLKLFSEEVKDLAGKGWTAEEISRKWFPPQRLVTWFSGGEMSPVHLVESVLREPF